jgi:hypothetical protein
MTAAGVPPQGRGTRRDGACGAILTGMDAASVRRFVDRPWDLLRAAKRRHWAEEVAARGPEAPLRASRALWLHMRRVRPDWPSDAERAEDLAHHVVLKGCLDRAARALARLPDR